MVLTALAFLPTAGSSPQNAHGNGLVHREIKPADAPPGGGSAPVPGGAGGADRAPGET